MLECIHVNSRGMKISSWEGVSVARNEVDEEPWWENEAVFRIGKRKSSSKLSY